MVYVDISIKIMDNIYEGWLIEIHMIVCLLVLYIIDISILPDRFLPVQPQLIAL